MCVLATGCGRIGFDTTTGDATGDTSAPWSCASAVFCDGFEAATLVPWTIESGGGGAMSARDTAMPHGDAAAFRVSTPAGSSFQYADKPLFGGKSTGDIWTRVWFWIPSGFVASHLDILEVGGGTGLGTIVVQGNTNEVAGYNSLGTSMGTRSGVPVPRDSWHCIELHIHIDPTAGDWAIYLDGGTNPIASESGVPTLPSGGFTACDVGVIYAAPGQVAATVYVDDVAVDYRRTGCGS